MRSLQEDAAASPDPQSRGENLRGNGCIQGPSGHQGCILNICPSWWWFLFADTQPLQRASASAPALPPEVLQCPVPAGSGLLKLLTWRERIKIITHVTGSVT